MRNRIGVSLSAVLAGFCVLLAGCGGTSLSGTSDTGSGGGGGGTTPTSSVPAYLNLSTGTLAAGQPVTMTATVTDAKGLAVSGVIVSFSVSPAGAAALTVSSESTASDGTMTAILTVLVSKTVTVTAAIAGTSLTASAAVTLPSSPNYKLGYFDSSSVFHSGEIQIGTSPIAAGGSTGLQVAIVDAANGNLPYAGSASVTFSSTCATKGIATILSPIESSSGTFDSTYTATGCNGSDTITASASLNSLTATGSITVESPTLGSIKFISANPETIGLPGTGLPASSQVTFQLLDANGNGVIGQAVSFTLSTSVGDVTITNSPVNTQANGFVSTFVDAGAVHTAVRVNATATDITTGKVIQSQSNLLTVTTGIPDQNSFSLSVTKHNIEGNDIDGVTATVQVLLADRYNNPVLDGTPVTLVTEGGSVVGSCTTSSNNYTTASGCTVLFTSQDPRTSQLAAPGTAEYTALNCGSVTDPFTPIKGCNDHRYTVIAYAVGEEGFTDTNGNGYYDAGEPFVDQGEPFLDFNEDGIFETAFETFYDFNNNGKIDGPSGNFTGVLCNSDCDTAHSLFVNQSMVMIMSSSEAIIRCAGANPNGSSTGCSPYNLPGSGAQTIEVDVYDTAGQNMAAGTTVAVSGASTGLTFDGSTSYSLPDLTGPGPYKAFFQVEPTACSAGCTFRIDVTATHGLDTYLIATLKT